ncbi:hypothetical protein G9U52_17685 [Paenibacillus sp. S3N08]|uniref:Glutamate/phenylalanine/leucine/valine/L-tryptophan dehydrogenase C-terminal domain-containing protein n=1 Tax=Paenibacillus agricola TaxID=2716264 RepID=A0ABX0J6A3_9BACL|nr:hypothetical protein [Paenibacillus agricola]
MGLEGSVHGITGNSAAEGLKNGNGNEGGIKLVLTEESEEEVNTKLKQIIVQSFYNVYQTSIDKKIDMRMAAYMVGLKRLVEAIKWRGWI